MGLSTDGHIACGIPYEEGFEFPWEKDKYDHCENSWWRDVNGYKPTSNPYDEEGERKPDFTEEQRDAHWKEQNQWDRDNPMPFKVINYCSGECPMMILAIPSTHIRANRGYPSDLNANDIGVVVLEEFNLFMDGLNRFDLLDEGECSEPKWMLFSSMD